MKAISQEEYIINDHNRYHLTISNFYRHDNHIIYEVDLLDVAFMYHYKFYFRFKTLKLLH
jgi:hypothetical protein